MKSRRRPRRKPATRTKSSKRTRRPSSRRRKRKSTDSVAGRRTRAYLGLGSNLGDRRSHLEAALAQIAAVTTLRKVSSFYRTEPVGFRDQPDFWNAVAEIAWRGTSAQLLSAVRSIERRVGRTPSFPNGPREIDVDILDFGGRVAIGGALELPHPRLSARRFALVPLAEINPAWRDPRTGRGILELLEALPSRPRVRRIPSARSGLPGPSDVPEAEE